MSQPLVTEKKCLVWCCDNWSNYKNIQCGSVPKNVKGGLGDRIRGMITVKIWARILNLDFYIIWDGDQFKDYFDFSDFNMLNIEKDDIGVYTYLYDKHHALNKVFICEKPENIFSNKINKILSNSMDWKNIFNNQYIDKNLLESNLDLEEYSILYTKTLVPTLKMKNLVLNIFKNHTHIPVINRLSEQLQNGACIVGVQIRTGDNHIDSNFKGDKLYNENSILNILNNIKIHLDINNIREYSIFLTSDFPDIYTCGKKIWPSEKIIYYDKKICHIDKSNDSNNIDKTYVDNYILSQHTEIIYGSLSSGFTKIAGLSSNHNNFYDISDFDTDKDNLHQITKTNKKQLLRFKCNRGRQKKNISNAELKLILNENNKI